MQMMSMGDSQLPEGLNGEDTRDVDNGWGAGRRKEG